MEPGKAGELVFDSPDAFARGAVHLYQSEKEWKVLQQQGFDLLEAQFLAKGRPENLLSHLDLTLSRLEEHREQNFTGAMLQHHALQSTKYLSKWINCKNTLKSMQQNS